MHSVIIQSSTRKIWKIEKIQNEKQSSKLKKMMAVFLRLLLENHTHQGFQNKYTKNRKPLIRLQKSKLEGQGLFDEQVLQTLLEIDYIKFIDMFSKKSVI